MEKEIINKLKYLIKKKKSFSEVCKELELKDYEVIGLITLLKEDGFLCDYVNGEIIRPKKPESGKIKIEPKQDEVKFLAISDIHYGSKWDNPNLVEYAFEVADKENCQFITNSGDIFEGDFHNKRPDHIYQVKALGMEQLDYVAETHPKTPNDIPYYFIIGNHDTTFIKTCGADMGKMLQQKRPDLTYLGADLADINIGKQTIRLRHGTGGNAYAKGYKLQKYCETLPISDIPDIILQGHFHYSAYFKNRDIHCVNVPSLQSYTPYAKALGLPQEIGFWIISYDLDKKGNMVSFTPELYQFDEPRKRVKK